MHNIIERAEGNFRLFYACISPKRVKNGSFVKGGILRRTFAV